MIKTKNQKRIYIPPSMRITQKMKKSKNKRKMRKTRTQRKNRKK